MILSLRAELDLGMDHISNARRWKRNRRWPPNQRHSSATLLREVFVLSPMAEHSRIGYEHPLLLMCFTLHHRLSS